MNTSQAPSAFGASSTAAEVIDGVDLHGRHAVVTGASSGIGVETVRALATAGADVTLAVRNTDAGATVADRLRAELPPESGKLSLARLELSDLSSVKAFAASWDGPLHILVNNAGVMAPPQIARTAEGRELQFGVNHLGHFALTTGLHPALAAANGARIVVVSSIGHLFSPVVFDDLDYRYRPYDPWTSYGQSKTAGIHFAVAAAERWARDGITANARQHRRHRPGPPHRHAGRGLDDGQRRTRPPPGQDRPAGRRHLHPAGRLTHGRRRHRPILRRLRPGQARHPTRRRHPRRRPVRPGSGERGTPLDRIRSPHPLRIVRSSGLFGVGPAQITDTRTA